MKKFFGIAAIIALIAIGSPSQAQDTTNVAKKAWKGTKKGVNKGWKATKKGVKKAGDETAETATKAKAKVTDKESDKYVGPGGQKIYIDDGDKYYWINDKGAREFVSKDQLKLKAD